MFKDANELWKASDLPNLQGRLTVITGTGGLGYECALAMARAGAEVILAGRSEQKGRDAIFKIRTHVPSANVWFEELDLADLASITAFGRRMLERNRAIHVLINNAAVIMSPKRQATKDGFELHFGTNHLGHFALTMHLMPLLRKAKDARVVTVAALAANAATIDFEDLQQERRYRSMKAYGQSKLANILFALELHRRSTAGNWGVASIAVHPGLSRTDLSGLKADNTRGNKMPFLLRLIGPIMLSSASQGARPTLFAATSPDVESGKYYGPGGFGEIRGVPAPAKLPSAATDEAVAKQLWAISKKMTQIKCPG
ncbi:SDR family oxidoreductase [Paraburkholderia caledonica]|uniref:NAD(P)-dependent dehydrogenase (Short-subunit alcohol dehydrogenase family) n=1 Tax=Paraburkholderia caledonica TaxID=134536 RepID=A0AB73IRN8_9BURK|nr:NAD(P)-dependent dehydrogenase (short-subunit alcohol dehydrogenase family) [Paraburkholderia caledonica]